MDRSSKCSGKVRLTKADAAHKANHYNKTTGDYMRYYHCPYCNHWHIGHSNQRKPSYKKTKRWSSKQNRALHKMRKQAGKYAKS